MCNRKSLFIAVGIAVFLFTGYSVFVNFVSGGVASDSTCCDKKNNVSINKSEQVEVKSGATFSGCPDLIIKGPDEVCPAVQDEHLYEIEGPEKPECEFKWVVNENKIQPRSDKSGRTFRGKFLKSGVDVDVKAIAQTAEGAEEECECGEAVKTTKSKCSFDKRKRLMLSGMKTATIREDEQIRADVTFALQTECEAKFSDNPNLTLNFDPNPAPATPKVASTIIKPNQPAAGNVNGPITVKAEVVPSECGCSETKKEAKLHVQKVCFESQNLDSSATFPSANSWFTGDADVAERKARRKVENKVIRLAKQRCKKDTNGECPKMEQKEVIQINCDDPEFKDPDDEQQVRVTCNATIKFDCISKK